MNEAPVTRPYRTVTFGRVSLTVFPVKPDQKVPNVEVSDTRGDEQRILSWSKNKKLNKFK